MSGSDAEDEELPTAIGYTGGGIARAISVAEAVDMAMEMAWPREQELLDLCVYQTLAHFHNHVLCALSSSNNKTLITTTTTLTISRCALTA
jgi:hypothetical protein